MSTKAALVELVQKLPEDVTYQQAMDEIYSQYVRQGIEEALKEMAEGKVIPHEQVVAEMAKWLK